MEKIVIFGAGKISSALLSLHKAHQDVFDDVIVGIIDNDIDKRGNYLYDYMIYSPDELPNISYDYVVIACNFYEEVVRQLEKDYSVILESGESRRHLYCTSLPYCEWYLVTVLPFNELDHAISGLTLNQL
jgi:FlaA1/EpsC-like NDP-sugar epimerase